MSDLIQMERTGTIAGIVLNRPARLSATTKPMRQDSGDARRLTDAEYDECFDCVDAEDFGIGYAAFPAREKPGFLNG